MDPRHQPAKGQGELGHLPSLHQQLGYVLQNSAALNILTQNRALAELFKMRHRRGQKAPRGMRNLSEMTRKHWALGTKTSPPQGEQSCSSLSYRFNFKYTQYSRKWNQSHCSQTELGWIFLSSITSWLFPRHSQATFCTLPSHIPSCSFQQSWLCPPGLLSLSVIPFMSCPKTVPDAVPAPQGSPHHSVLSVPLSIRNCLPGMGGHLGVFALQVWICFIPKQSHLPRNRRLLSSAKLHLSLVKSLFSLTASNHQLASLPREKFYPFC